jgi:hypothetical protein
MKTRVFKPRLMDTSLACWRNTSFALLAALYVGIINCRPSSAQQDSPAASTVVENRAGNQRGTRTISEAECQAMVERVVSHCSTSIEAIVRDSDAEFEKIYQNADSLSEEQNLKRAITDWRPARDGGSLPADKRLIDIASREELLVNIHKYHAYTKLLSLQDFTDKSKYRQAHQDVLRALEQNGLNYWAKSSKLGSLYSVLSPNIKFPIETASPLLVNDCPYDSFGDYYQSEGEINEKWLAVVTVKSRENGRVTFQCRGNFFCPVTRRESGRFDRFGGPIYETVGEGENTLSDLRRRLAVDSIGGALFVGRGQYSEFMQGRVVVGLDGKMQYAPKDGYLKSGVRRAVQTTARRLELGKNRLRPRSNRDTSDATDLRCRGILSGSFEVIGRVSGISPALLR